MRKAARRAGQLLLFALAAVCLVMVVTLADCGCKEDGEAKSDAPVEAERRTSGDVENPTERKSPSQAAMESALENGKPVFLNFHSNRCIPCIEMEKVIEEVEPEYAGRVEFVVVDVYDSAESSFCEYFQVRVIPTSFFIQPDGAVADAYEGLMGSDQMRMLLDKLISGGGRAPQP